MRAQPHPSPSPGLRLTIVLAGLAFGCGRVPLDLPVVETGAGGAAAVQTGAAGTSGTFTGAAGTSALAGTSGTFTGAAGTGALAGTSGTFTGAAGTTVGQVCAPGTSACTADNAAVQVCTPDGFWGVPSTCQNGCSGGICRECIPGESECVSATELQICRPSAVWSVVTKCGGGCTNGACIAPPVCTPGAGQCLSDIEGELCRADGTWGLPYTCANGCSNGICLECVPSRTSCVSLSQMQLCQPTGVWSATMPCRGVCTNDVCTATAKLVFVTSVVVEGGALGGLAGADALCQKLALTGGLPGTYKAWLSDSTSSPSTRFTQGGAPYELRDGTVVAFNWMALTSGILAHAINQNEVGGPPVMGTDACGDQRTVWTDTSYDGTLTDPGTTCGDWKDVTSMGGAWGDATETANWSVSCGGFGVSASGVPLCSLQSALYCFEQ